MPRRRFIWWNKPVVLDEFKPAPKKSEAPGTRIRGCVWDVVYLIGGGKGAIGRTTPNAHDATHRGFRSEWYRRV